MEEKFIYFVVMDKKKKCWVKMPGKKLTLKEGAQKYGGIIDAGDNKKELMETWDADMG